MPKYVVAISYEEGIRSIETFDELPAARFLYFQIRCFEHAGELMILETIEREHENDD